MNIAIISTFDKAGGAAIAAHRLCKALRHLKQDAVMIVKFKNSKGPYTYQTALNDPQFAAERKIFKNIQEVEINQNRTELTNTWFSIPYPGYDISKTPIIVQSDIINLHWVAEFQSVETITSLLKTGKPVVWTLHDENPYTGGCHYTAGCTKYQEDCYDCLQLKENRNQVPFYNLKNKIKLWGKNLTIVTPSRWLAESAGKSRVFKDLRIEIIPNSLETHIFKPKPKPLAKEELRIEPHVITLLFGAHTGNEKRKGFFKLLEALNHCLQDEKFKHLAKTGGMRIMTFGPPQEELREMDLEIKTNGYIEDDDKLATIYSAADMFILPSLEDNLPNTMLEAMACGTPVISFEVGGMPDLIQNGVTGYMAPCFESQEFGQLILKLVFNKNLREEMSANCRELIVKKFKLQDQAERYLVLFNQLLKTRKRTRIKENLDEIIPRSGTINLHQWASPIQDHFLEMYRKSALDLLTNETLNKNEISKIYGSYSYKIGKTIIYPIKKIRNIVRKIQQLFRKSPYRNIQ
jgi:glycosyltransferase involved in cell wall biosynthesis